MRPDKLPENQFEEMLKKGRKDLDELKNAQFSGSDANRVYLLSTDQSWDYYVDAASHAAADMAIELNWEHQDYGYGVVCIDVFLDVVDDAHRVKVGDLGARDFFSSVLPPNPAIPRTVDWQFGVTYNDDTVSHRYYYKIYYLTTDTVL